MQSYHVYIYIEIFLFFINYCQYKFNHMYLGEIWEESEAVW